MKKVISISLLICLAVSIIAPCAHAGKIKDTVTKAINSIKSRGLSSGKPTTAHTCVRG
ncbi:MAG: hypothetical protein ACE5JK_03940 [Candidatus Omnitrophota bacterium]